MLAGFLLPIPDELLSLCSGSQPLVRGPWTSWGRGCWLIRRPDPTTIAKKQYASVLPQPGVSQESARKSSRH